MDGNMSFFGYMYVHPCMCMRARACEYVYVRMDHLRTHMLHVH